jgi:hypothetical protein
MNRSKALINGAFAAAAIALVAMHGNATAADCKGLEKAKCEGNSSCSWVDSYKRKDGVQVSGHCRKKGGKKSLLPSDD